MSKGTWAATAADSIAVPADTYRGEIDLQLASGGPVWLGFGEPAVVNEGLFLSSGGSFMPISDHRARLAVHMICAEGSEAAGGYQTA